MGYRVLRRMTDDPGEHGHVSCDIDVGETRANTAQSEIWLPQILAIIREDGFSAFSLATVAERLGTSARMLVYHFGSKDQLLGRLLRASRDERIELFAEAPHDTLAGAIDQWWGYFSANLAEMDLFFHIVRRRYADPAEFEQFAETAVDGWAAHFAESARQERPDLDAEAVGHLTVATMRGLLADLMITADRSRVELALGRYRALLGTVGYSTTPPRGAM